MEVSLYHSLQKVIRTRNFCGMVVFRLFKAIDAQYRRQNLDIRATPTTRKHNYGGT